VFGTIVGHFKPHRVAVVALRQFALQRQTQVLHLFLVEEQIRIARDPELVAAEYVHALEQIADIHVHGRRQEDKAVVDAGEFPRQLDHAGQGPWRLHDGVAGTATEGVPPLQFDGEIQTLVEHARERVRRIQPDRRQHRHQFAGEVVAYPAALFISPCATAQEDDAFGFERREDDVVEQRVLFGDELMRLAGDQAQCLLR
jgi:hypothetical protein